MSADDRLAELESRVALAELEAAYAVHWDTGQGERWADLFTSDGVFELVGVPHRPGFVVEGRAALATFCHDVNRRWQGVHLMHPPHLLLDGASATGTVYFQFRSIVQEPGFTQLGTITGWYDVDYVRRDGSWRIRRRIEHTLGNETAEHYGSGGAGGPSVPR